MDTTRQTLNRTVEHRGARVVLRKKELNSFPFYE